MWQEVYVVVALLPLSALKRVYRPVDRPFGGKAALDEVDLWLEDPKGCVGVAPKELFETPPVTDIFDPTESDVGAKGFVGPQTQKVADLPVDGKEGFWIEPGKEDAASKGAKARDGMLFWLVAQLRESVDDGLGHRHFAQKEVGEMQICGLHPLSP